MGDALALIVIVALTAAVVILWRAEAADKTRLRDGVVELLRRLREAIRR